jgi:serine protease inhibitor
LSRRQADRSLQRRQLSLLRVATKALQIGRRQRLFIREVLHKGFVSLDESGTGAAAATAVVIEEESAPATPIEMTIDSPFIFLIRDVETGTILFVGRVLNPVS